MERVLIIDDNHADRALLRMAMEFIQWPARISEFGNGAAAIKEMREWSDPPPTVIFLDYLLGSTASTPWIARLRERCPVSTTMIVLLSTMLPSEVQQKQCLSQGACLFLEKSTTFAELIKLVGQVRRAMLARNGRE
jgi:DNA-binding response OmpR family regulator